MPLPVGGAIVAVWRGGRGGEAAGIYRCAERGSLFTDSHSPDAASKSQNGDPKSQDQGGESIINNPHKSVAHRPHHPHVLSCGSPMSRLASIYAVVVFSSVLVSSPSSRGLDTWVQTRLCATPWLDIVRDHAAFCLCMDVRSSVVKQDDTNHHQTPSGCCENL